MNAVACSAKSTEGLTPRETRELLKDVQEAGYGRKGLAVVRNIGLKSVIEYPIGTPLYRGEGWVSHMRLSPDGGSIAFIDHAVRGDDSGTVTMIDLRGKARKLTQEFASAQGLAWTPDGKEIWFTAAENGFFSILRAVTPAGRQRIVYSTPGRSLLHDISSSGRVLMALETLRVGVIVLPHGETAERDLSWLDASFGTDLSDDGRQVLICEQGEGSGPNYGVYLRPVDGSPAVRISDGFATSLSRDGTQVIVTGRAGGARADIVPTGPGTHILLPAAAKGNDLSLIWPAFFPDGKRIFYTLKGPKTPARIWVQEIATGKAWPVSPEGFGLVLGPRAVSPDGKWIAVQASDSRLFLLPVDGGCPRLVPGSVPGEMGLKFSAGGKTLYTAVGGELPSRIYQVDLIAGTRSVWRELHPPDPSGISFTLPSAITPDGLSYAYTYLQMTGDLYLVDGLH